MTPGQIILAVILGAAAISVAISVIIEIRNFYRDTED